MNVQAPKAALAGAESFFRPATVACPFAFYDAARSQTPVVKVRHPDLQQDIYMVISYDHILQVTAQPELFSSEFAHILFAGGSINPEADAIIAPTLGEPTFLLTWDDPKHRLRRNMIGATFNPKAVNELMPHLERITDELIDGFIEQGECDFVADFAVQLPIYMILDMLGLPRTMYDQVHRWSDSILLRVGKMASHEQEIAAAYDIAECHGFIIDLIEQRRRDQGADVVSQVIAASDASETPLTRNELMSLVQEVLIGGNETTRNTLIDAMARLAANPDQLALLREDPALIANAADELLRLATPAAGMWRIAKRDTEIGGVPIPAGAVVSLRYDSANRDPTRFAEPEALDVRRPNARDQMSFSRGIHHCLGMHLARREITVAIARLATRLHNVRETTDTAERDYHPNFMIRARKGLRIAFDPGPRLIPTV